MILVQPNPNPSARHSVMTNLRDTNSCSDLTISFSSAGKWKAFFKGFPQRSDDRYHPVKETMHD
jgi:hypothetical protein